MNDVHHVTHNAFFACLFSEYFTKYFLDPNRNTFIYLFLIKLNKVGCFKNLINVRKTQAKSRSTS